MNIFEDVKKAKQQARRPQTTIIKVESYEIDAKEPRKSAIKGIDMLNNDENGIPKKVTVNALDPSNKSMGINDFADPNAMMHTEPGGLLRLDRFIVRSDGNYVTRHMQRVAKTDGPRVNRNQEKSDIGFMKAWTKVIPERDQQGNVAEFEVNGKTLSRGRANLIPDSSVPIATQIGSDQFRVDLSRAVEDAVKQAPERTKPMLLLRSEGDNNQTEVVLQTLQQNADNSYSLMTKEEILEAARNNNNLKTFLDGNEKYKAAGKTQDIEILSGFQMDLVGLTKDPRSGEELANPRVQSMVRETARYFAKPKTHEQEEQQYTPAKAPEYKLSVVSYSIPQSNDTKLASLETLGAMPGVVASPDAGLSVTTNPYYPHPSTQAAPSPQAPAPQAGTQAPETQAPETQAPAASRPATTPEEPPLPDDIDAQLEPDSLLHDDMIDDFDVDDLEEQLAAQGH